MGLVSVAQERSRAMSDDVTSNRGWSARSTGLPDAVEVPGSAGRPTADAVHPATLNNAALTPATTRALVRHIDVPAITPKQWRESDPDVRKPPKWAAAMLRR